MRTPQYRYGVRPGSGQWSSSSMVVQIHRVDGSPSHDRRGERLHQDGCSLDEMIAELRAMAARLRAVDAFGNQDAPARRLAAGPLLIDHAPAELPEEP